MQQIKRLFAPPEAANPYETRQVNIINTILLVVILGSLVLLIASIIDGQRAGTRVMVVVFGVGVGLWLVFKRGNLLIPGILFPLTILAGITYLLWNGDGIRDEVMLALPIVIALGSFMLGGNSTLWFTLAVMTSVTVTAVAEITGRLIHDVTFKTDIFDVVIYNVFVGITGALIHILVSNLTNSLNLARENEQKALSSNRELESIRRDLEVRVIERTRDLAVSADVSRRLSTILNLDHLVLEVVEQVKTAFGYYHVHIYLLDSRGETLNMVGGTGEAGQTMLEAGHTIPVERGLVGRAARTNQTVFISDTTNEEGWLANPLLSETKAEAAVPIRFGDTVLGVLDVQHNVVNGLTEDDMNVLESIANQVAIAIRNARQYAQTQESEARLRAMIEAIPTGVMITRVGDGVVLYANENAAALFGYPRHELIGNATPNLYYHLSDRNTILGILARDGKLPNYEVLGRRKDNTSVWVALSVQKMEYAGESAFYINATDITGQRQASEALLKRAERDRVLNQISTKIRGAVSMEQILQAAVQEVRQVTGASRGVVKIDPQEESGSVESMTHSVGAMERSE